MSSPEHSSRIIVRSFRESDSAEVLNLAPRLAEGVAPWRDSSAILRAVRGWVEGSIASATKEGHVAFVAEEEGEKGQSSGWLASRSFATGRASWMLTWGSS